MKIRIRQFSALTRLTALETIRQPIFLLVTTACYLLIALMPVMITHTLGEGAKMTRDSALALQFVCAIILGGFAACSTLAREIRQGTAASILSKPVNREIFFLSKFTGVGLVLLLFAAGAIACTIMSARTAADDFILDWWSGAPLFGAIVTAYALAGLCNFLDRRSFSASAFSLLLVCIGTVFLGAGFIDRSGQPAFFGVAYSMKVLPAGILIAMAGLVFTGLAVGLATRLPTFPTLAICGLVLTLGLISDYTFGRHADHSLLASILYTLLPNWQHFWVADALAGDGSIPWTYVGWAGLYAGIYLCGILALGMLAFRAMDIEA